ncbi:MAG: hypothetical protein ACK5WP_09535 [Neisseriaceae bacterium]|jgi:hypothetical protein
MKISLTWITIDEMTLRSNAFFLNNYYKITKIEKQTKYKLEFYENGICYKTYLKGDKLDNLKQWAEIHAESLLYYHTLGEGVISQCMSRH